MLDFLRDQSFAGGEVIDIADHRSSSEPDVDAARVREMVRSLPDRQAAVIELRRQDLSQSQVSRILGISQQAVSRIENRAKARLRKLAA